jgi:hypothetical protein
VIEAISELFVERVPRAPVRPALVQASSLLVVDACGGARRIADLTQLVESRAPVRASYVAFDLVDTVSDQTAFDSIWLFVDGASDLSYCGLCVRELGEQFDGAGVHLIGVGDVASDECAVRLDEAMAGSAPPWRRSRDLARGAELLRERLVGA